MRKHLAYFTHMTLKSSLVSTLLFTSLLFTPVHADELEIAYQKEYAYLVAEKDALEKRLASLSQSQQATVKKVSDEIDGLQRQYLTKQNQVDRLNSNINDASRDVDFSENDRLLLETTLIQAKATLEKLGVTVDESLDFDQQLKFAFENAQSTMASDGAIEQENAQYFGVDGREVNGAVLNVGRIARYGLVDGAQGVLAPTGGGKFKVWDNTSMLTASALADGQRPVSLDIFLFDNAEVGIEKQSEKGFSDDVKAGGLIGKIILAIGVVGLVLVGLRIMFLISFGSDIQKMTLQVNKIVESQGVNAALKACKKKSSSASRVISATLRNIKKERDHIEDIISESILYESSKIDRFGSGILVIAAVSPLLGLLGTVTGMIGTFDIITEFGTGDPKLLSTGISEALITTKFGLIVAIPLLLIGNMLSNWALRTKNGLERAALNVINTHKETLPLVDSAKTA
mgnify:FL=1